MEIVFAILYTILCTAPFVLLCLACLKVNLNVADRGKQFLMPIIALVYCTLVLIFMSDIGEALLWIIKKLSGILPFLTNINWNAYLIYVFNIAAVLLFLLVKKICLGILDRIWSNSRELMEATAGIFYEYEDDVDKWLLNADYAQVKFYSKGFYYTALAVSTLIFVLSQVFTDTPFFHAVFYPVFGVLVLGEIVNFLSGITKSDFVEDILGEDEESYKIANYGLLREVLKDLFGDRVLYDNTSDSGLEVSSTFETLDEMRTSSDQTIRNMGEYFNMLKENGEKIDPNYVKSCVNLIQGNSTLFSNPFYRDLTNYLMFPMFKQLMQYRKCLVVMGRDSATEDVKSWLEEGIMESIHTDSLWKVDILTEMPTEADIAIMKFCDLYNLEIQKNNAEFLSNVGFVFIVEPSRLLATGQMGVSLLVNRFDETRGKVVYCACDRNCDGLVDALSHVLRTNITEVLATLHGSATTSVMNWDADGDYMHHKIFSNVSRYLGMGTEINAVAMKHQIANTTWISSEKFPVLDMKWIAGQYYKKICGYTNLPVSQESFNKAFRVEANLWNLEKRKNAFITVEDEFQNLFELIRLFSTRQEQQGFINIISENYLLRDYMLGNVQTFMADPKAIPTIVADYARTERNTVLKLVMRMTEEQVSEDDVVDALMYSGIKFDDPFETLKSLIRKHCAVEEISIRVYFREQLMADALRTEVKKYYAIEGETEIAEYAKNLKNAYYIAEDEKGELYYIGAKLYGHVFQSMIPGQFLTYAGKYYEVQSITPINGVVVRRAADHITDRKYYRQIRHYNIADWKDDDNVGGQKSIAGIQIEKGYCKLGVKTDGYLQMSSYDDFKTAQKVYVSGIPDRSYRNKLVLKIQLPKASEKVRYTICVLLNEIFKTTYPDSYQYVCAVTPVHLPDDMPENLRYAMHEVITEPDDTAIYIVEDSEIDLGLIASVERNMKRYFELITELLIWHEEKMNEKVETPVEEEFVPEFDIPPSEVVKMPGFFAKLKMRIKKLIDAWKKALGIKDKKKPAEASETPIEEAEGTEGVDTEGSEFAEGEETEVSEADGAVEGEETEVEAVEGEDADAEDSVDDEETAVDDSVDDEETVVVEDGAEGLDADDEETAVIGDSESTELVQTDEQLPLADKSPVIMRNIDDLVAEELADAEGMAADQGDSAAGVQGAEEGTEEVPKDNGLDIEGEDEQLVRVLSQLTDYQKTCFLKFGYDECEGYFDFAGTIEYLSQFGYDRGPLRQVRDSEALAEEYEKVYDPKKVGSHYCDFCGVELVGGEYELLKDGRERCNRCSATALRTGDEFKEVFKTVLRNMEIFYGIKLKVAIKVRMTDAKKIARHFGEEFVATPGFDGRTLGFAQKDSTGYSIYIENGSPKLAAMATIAHELTHIWQYQNWNDADIIARYGAHNRLEVYEGMAKWAEIQYLIHLNEISYAKRQEIITRLRDDEYGKGFRKYAAKYSFSYNQARKVTPFEEMPPL